MCGMRSDCVAFGGLVAGLLLLPHGGGGAATPPRAGVTKGATIAASPVLPWIEDDLPRAMAEAKTRKLPIFVESWAPW